VHSARAESPKAKGRPGAALLATGAEKLREAAGRQAQARRKIDPNELMRLVGAVGYAACLRGLLR